MRYYITKLVILLGVATWSATLYLLFGHVASQYKKNQQDYNLNKLRNHQIEVYLSKHMN